MMDGFLKDKPNPNTTPFDEKCAKHLIKTLKQNRKLSRSSKTQGWPLEFAKLRKEVNTKDEIKTVLKWYRKNCHLKYVPDCRSASSFRKKFFRLADAMLRTKDDESKLADPSQIKIRQDIINLEENYLPGFYWPNDEKKDELVFLQLSHDNFSKLHEGAKQLWFWAEKHDPLYTKTGPNTARGNGNSIEFTAESFYEMLKSPFQHTIDWAIEVHRLAYEWDNWSGNLLSWVWRPELKLARRALIDVVETALHQDYDRASATLDRILEGIKNHG